MLRKLCKNVVGSVHPERMTGVGLSGLTVGLIGTIYCIPQMVTVGIVLLAYAIIVPPLVLLLLERYLRDNDRGTRD